MIVLRAPDLPASDRSRSSTTDCNPNRAHAQRAPHARAREGFAPRRTDDARDAATLLVVLALAVAGTFAIGAVYLGAPRMVAMVVGWL